MILVTHVITLLDFFGGLRSQLQLQGRMANSDSEDGGYDVELEKTSDGEDDQDRIGDDLLDGLDADAVAEDVSEGDEVRSAT